MEYTIGKNTCSFLGAYLHFVASLRILLVIHSSHSLYLFRSDTMALVFNFIIFVSNYYEY